MLRRSVVVERSARLEHCIIMERSRIGPGAQVRRAIIDQDNHLPPGERIGFDPEEDRRRFHVTESGIVVVPAGYFPPRTRAGVHAKPRHAQVGEVAERVLEVPA
jgi:glucose-1-phosphate adenylyltransferase